MAYDGLITKSVIQELKTSLIGGKIDRVLQPNKSEVVLNIYNNGQNYFLCLSVDPSYCRVALTTHLKPNPQNALGFCMFLRKYLINSRIVDISNYDFERTIRIKFSGYNEYSELVTLKLYIEVMSRQSNIILTNENDIIIDSIRHTESDLRETLPNRKYEFVQITKKSILQDEESLQIINKEDFENDIHNHLLEEGNSYIKILQETYIGFSKSFIKSVLQKVSVEENDFSQDSIEKVYNEIKSIILAIKDNNVSCEKIENDYTICSKATDNNLAINNFLDEYYYNKETTNVFNNSKNSLLSITLSSLKKIQKKLYNINEKLKECNQMDKYKLYGELLTANLYKINPNQVIDKIELENYYDENKLLSIPLDNTINIKRNIDKYFKKYNKLKNASVIVQEQKIEAEKEIDYIQSIVFSIENAKSIKDINEVYEEISNNLLGKKISQSKKKQKVQKHNVSKMPEIDYVEFEGYKIYIGKNNIQNDYLTLKFANRNDIWFHTQDVHGSHIILRVSEKPELNTSNISNNLLEMIPANIIEYCAKLAKENSKAKDDTGAMVDYCLIKNVRKQPSGKPGMVNYTNYKSIYIK